MVESEIIWTDIQIDLIDGNAACLYCSRNEEGRVINTTNRRHKKNNKMVT